MLFDSCRRAMEQTLGCDLGFYANWLMIETLGGLLVYIPCARTVHLWARNEAIFLAFTGDNHAELAQRFGLSVCSVYRILRYDSAGPQSENYDTLALCWSAMLEELGPVEGRRAIQVMVAVMGGCRVHIPSTRTLKAEARRINEREKKEH